MFFLVPILALGLFWHPVYNPPLSNKSITTLSQRYCVAKTTHTVFEDKIKVRYRSTECRYDPFIVYDKPAKEILSDKAVVFYKAFLFDNNACSSFYLRGPPCALA